MKKNKKQYPCIESTLDFPTENHRIRLWINEEEIKDIDEAIITILVATIVSTSISFYFDTALDTRTSKRQFFYEFSRTFFDNPKYRDISIALEEQYLYGRGKIFTINGGKFS